GGPMKQVLVFVNAKIECRRLARQLQKAGVNADAIHGDKTQEERMKALEGFKRGDIEVLVATDVAARGLDIVELPVVINYDVPFNPEDYVHRIGRTGRAGATGLAIMLMTGADERGVQAIERLTKQKFDIRPLEVQRAPRRERGERRDRTLAAPPAPADDFFSKPYEPAATEAEAAGAETADAAAPGTRKPAKVAALLGGIKR
ncbi:MAG TPA: C-terminal helicase domain-containing protein, partial [Burkholderiaceae bacterium]|nr:C-terminal helicase domain-containing protein [Burkholderiaceae bacterium]